MYHPTIICCSHIGFKHLYRNSIIEYSISSKFVLTTKKSRKMFIVSYVRDTHSGIYPSLSLIILCDMNLIKRFMHYGVTMRFRGQGKSSSKIKKKLLANTRCSVPWLTACDKQVY